MTVIPTDLITIGLVITVLVLMGRPVRTGRRVNRP
ncbi:hypothetical protein QIP23_gp3 [ssRNA phage Esthiorhiza.1_11]|uniref:Uncharacterized protein n=2 Tax=Leviviricetes TaxID=2842243 RepID=A0A8S5KXQ2_9VIRU|nr:hypothetical protein QIP23_gp3 [ssRNA phage Esthiorhiza.1_11]QDH90718.1 MAG: hypothetical protein H1RhizoLitter1485_000003 [Leviviridae sp.]DAD49931.1 TPA_asm: hypothetical protein [ssRNA phage Esthiorhiza.1_11]